MKLTDTHCHLFLPEFDADRAETIRRALDSEITRIFLPNVDSGTSEQLLGLANTYPAYCFPMMGLHPTSVEEDYRQELDHVANRLAKHHFYGIGEIGIDLYHDQTFKSEQEDAFTTQIQWADELNLPVVIHTRNSFHETIRLLDRAHVDNLTGIFHCFTGSSDEAKEVINRGFYLGIGGVLTFKNSGLAEVISRVDPKHLVLETDAPYLAPAPKRGKRNEPSYLRYTAKKLAEITGLSFQQIAEITTTNSLKIFNLPE